MNTTSAKSANSSTSGRLAEVVSQDDPVDSWEDIADTDTPPVGGVDSPVILEKSTQQNLSTNKLITQNDIDARSSKVSRSSTAGEKESGSNNGSSVIGTSSVSSSNGSKKNPSPNLSDKKPGRSESKQAASAAALQLPPPKTEDDKENLNIVFIGHVGKEGV